MDRIQMACLCLIASACILAGLLVTRMTPSEAQALLTNSKGRFTFLTAQTKANEESLFVVDGFNEKLLIYKADLGKGPSGRVELMQAFDLPKLFASGTKGGDKPKP
jgi:hypothetical protein